MPRLQPLHMLNTSLPPWPAFTPEEATAAHDILLSNRVNYWTGTEGRLFEEEFAQWVGVKHAIALANGTLALDLALEALGVGPGDEVIVTPRTFLASVSCVVRVGATPVFADVDRDSGNITAATVAAVRTPRTKAVIAVHLAGWPCDLAPLMALAAEHGFFVVEDCAQAHGARYRGQSVGSIGHVAAWSFCQDKIMTTAGEGGMITTNDSALWDRLWSLKDHGKSYDAVHNRQHPPGFRWLHERFGTNARMTEIQSAIGRIQLRRMPQWSAQRAANAAALTAALAPFAGPDGVVRTPAPGCPSCPVGAGCAQCVHAWYKYYAYLRPDRLASGWTRDRIIAECEARGVPCYQGSCSEVYREQAFDGTPWRPATPLPVARELGDTSLMLLVHPTLEAQHMDHMATTLTDILTMAAV